ncbi:MAG: hypothetical protein PHE09_01195 [Oscillospiraceae bacterium]|nr:hypothetical protein [Oscillospiraceae bacterium]
MKITHFLYPDSDNCIYCKKINGFIKIVPMKTPCLRCERYRGSIQGEGCECCWDDFDFDCDVSVLDQSAEYERVNSFRHAPKEKRLAAWSKANDTAAALRDAPDRGVWQLMRDFVGLLRDDEYDALSYMGEKVSFEGISGEDSYDFIKAQKKYQNWLEELKKEIKRNV